MTEDAFNSIIKYASNYPIEETVIYKSDHTRLTHESFMNKVEGSYSYNESVLEKYSQSYKKVKAMVDFNLFMVRNVMVVLFVGFILMIVYIYSFYRYDIVLYSSLGYSKGRVCFLTTLNHIYQ